MTSPGGHFNATNQIHSDPQPLAPELIQDDKRLAVETNYTNQVVALIREIDSAGQEAGGSTALVKPIRLDLASLQH
jgi:hypothetical protein